jgi:hypothetical protein
LAIFVTEPLLRRRFSNQFINFFEKPQIHNLWKTQ